MIATTDHQEDIVYANVGNQYARIAVYTGHSSSNVISLDLDFLQQVRNQVPITKQRRPDIYDVIDKQSVKGNQL